MGEAFDTFEKRPEGEANFNDEVWVKVTPAGEQAFNEHYAQFRESFEKAQVPIPKLERGENGWTRMQLHQVAVIFGRHMYHSNQNPPLEMNFRTINPNKR